MTRRRAVPSPRTVRASCSRGVRPTKASRRPSGDQVGSPSPLVRCGSRRNPVPSARMIASRPPRWKVSDLPLGDQTGPDSPTPCSTGNARRTRRPRPLGSTVSMLDENTSGSHPCGIGKHGSGSRHLSTAKATRPFAPGNAARASPTPITSTSPAASASQPRERTLPRPLRSHARVPSSAPHDSTTRITPEGCARSPSLETPSRPAKAAGSNRAVPRPALDPAAAVTLPSFSLHHRVNRGSVRGPPDSGTPPWPPSA